MPYKDKEQYKEYQRRYAILHRDQRRAYKCNWERQQHFEHPGYRYKHHPYDVAASARRKVSWAIETGRLTKEPCRICGDPKSIAHHQDYSKPLDVWWLCQQCHSQLHREV